MTVLELLEVRHPEAVKKWDRHNYKITGPISLDDEAVVMVRLDNAGGMYSVVAVPLTMKRVV